MAATNCDMLPPLPGGSRIPVVPKGPGVVQLKLEKLVPLNVQLLLSIVAAGERHGIATPINHVLLVLLRAINDAAGK